MFHTFISVLLFNGFEPLDVFGPVEVLGDLEDCRLGYFSLEGGLVGCRQGFRVETLSFSELPAGSILLVPGGMGTRLLSEDAEWLEHLNRFVEDAETVLSVCTGSTLLAAASCLEKRRATTNKASWKWATSFGCEVFGSRVHAGSLTANSGRLRGYPQEPIWRSLLCKSVTGNKKLRPLPGVWNT